MADKTIGQLTAATQLNDQDLMVLEQGGTAKKMAGSVLKQYVVGQGGIDHITLNADYTLTVTYTSGQSWTTPQSIRGAQGAQGNPGADGEDGNGIVSVTKTGTSGLIDTYTITFTDGTTSTFQITNGEDGNTPVITATKSGKVTTIYSDGAAIATVNDGTDGQGTALSNPNLLINHWFEVNQRQVTNFTVGKYGVDRWKLVSGSASVVNGGIQLNGTLRQILEYPVENTVFASVKMTSGTATATYNDTTKYFDIVSSGGVIRAAKLEIGTVSTLQNDVKPNLYEQLQICKRFYEEVIFSKRNYICEPQYVYTPSDVSQSKFVSMLRFSPKRSYPEITIKDYDNVAIYWRPVTSGSANYLETLSLMYGSVDYENGTMVFTVQAKSNLPVGIHLVSVEPLTWYNTPFMIIDAEIN